MRVRKVAKTQDTDCYEKKNCWKVDANSSKQYVCRKL